MLNLLLLYVAGHVVIITVAFLFFRFLRREPNLPGRREAVFELNHRPARIEAGEAELGASRTELKNVDRRTEEVQAVLVDHVPLDDPPATKWAFGWLSGILTELEAAVFFLLTAPSAMLGLTAGAWAILAPPIAVAWVLILHVLMGAVVADKHRPARTVRHAKVGAVLFGTAIITAVWLVLSGRNLTDPNLIEELTGVGLMVLAALLSVCGAFCSLVATTLLEAQRNERELERLDARRHLYTRHIELLERDLARLKATSTTSPDPTVTAPPPTATGAAPAGIVTTVMLLLLLLGLPHGGFAQTVTDGPTATSITEASQASVIPFARLAACEFIVDLTSSTDRPALQRTLADVSQQLPAIIEALGCKLLRLVPFAGDLFVDVEEIVLPAIADPVAACRDINVTPVSARARATELLYPRLAANHDEQAKKACVEERRRQDGPALAERARLLTRAAERLRALGDLDSRGPCTALHQVVVRSFARAQHAVVITDGGQTCPPTGTVAVPPDARVLFLLIPPNSPGSSDRANVLLARLAALERTFPTARALFAPEATPAFWHHLAGAQ